MTNILKGKAVADKINDRTNEILKKLSLKPHLAILRCGNKSDDIAYEKKIYKRCADFNISCNTIIINEDTNINNYLQEIDKCNKNKNIDGIILLNQLYPHESSSIIDINKDIDGTNPLNVTAAFLNKEDCFIPCTAQAVIELLDYYNIDVTGKNVTIIGRSMTVGKPLSMLLLNRNATITVCHSHSQNIREHTLNSDIVIAAVGQAEVFDKSYFRQGQTVIDVGINYSEQKQKMCGDVLFDEVKDLVENITPVPFGVGTITNAVLINHLALAAKRRNYEN
ncbi:MAG: bifunctional 5,10-methylenetetrahydrofolate dehydrogenase/5,10-methenyltetrahydrofolate cyclohydrolase [Erysipelotrichia bacterium]|nr:bifunctional 5,10-methylenetetrahydrofolate dehydrogenase/5,10-methenyltetrahydrofolate cyclohydrolase [Erysipelotrichia bacterium]